MNKALVPTFKIYLSALKYWMSDEYDEEAILVDKDIEVGEGTFGTYVKCRGNCDYSLKDAFGLLMKCLRAGSYAIGDIETLNYEIKCSRSKDFEEFLGDIVDDYKDISKELAEYFYCDLLGNKSRYLLDEIADIISLDVERYIDWVFSSIRCARPVVSDEKFASELLECIKENGDLDEAIPSDEDLWGVIRQLLRICDVNQEKYADKILELYGVDWIDKKYNCVRASLADMFIKNGYMMMFEE